jgi:DUF1680 family protein
MPFARRMRPLPLSKIRITDPFWSEWQRKLVETTLPHEFANLETRLENFRRVARGETGGHVGLPFDDSDVTKWAEACAYALTAHPNAALRKMLDEAIEIVVAAQKPDGYLDTYIQLDHPGGEWRNLNALHEMYCAGHLIEAGVALSENLGDRRLLDVGIRFADHILSIFGPDKRLGYCGHEEIELALIKLAAHTGEKKYREFARWLVEVRGSRPSPFEAELRDPSSIALSPWGAKDIANETYDGEYCQDHAPIREHDAVVGHAVRAMYLYIAAADLADGQNDLPLETALQRAWDSLVKRRMYVTGGIGPSRHNEGFTADFDLPNLSAYAETCAAIGLVLWGQKMLEMTGNGEFAETVERALYNGALAGLSLSGDRFFYDNPLESRGAHERTPWFTCACCPPNIARMIGNLGAMVASAREDAFYVHQFAGFTAEATLGGVATKIELEGEFPWSTTLKIKVDPAKPAEFAVYVRIPDWADEVSTELPGAEEEADFEDGYAVFRRVWKPGDVLSIDLGTEPRWVEADPRVRENLGRVALTYGPLVYCLEEKDLGCAPQLFTADTQAPIEPVRENRLGGIAMLPVEGQIDVELFPDSLYAPLGSSEFRQVTAQFVPYYAWNNRGPNAMQIWVRRS